MNNYQITQLSIVEASGPDHLTFLQGQLTADVNKLPANNWCYAGHCDAKGKLWSVMRVVKLSDKIVLLIPRASLDDSLAQLKKFSVFSKVEFIDRSEQWSILFNPAETAPLHSVNEDTHNCVLGLGDAVLRIMPTPTSEMENGDDTWLRYEIEHGVASLAPATIGQYVPQMVGLDRLGGIDFKKGCYIGQETVARMHYLGQNKRLLRQLQGSAISVPVAGAVLERQQGDNWRRTGAVLNAVRYDNGDVVLLAVLPADIEQTATLRIKDEENSLLTLCPPFDNQEIADE